MKFDAIGGGPLGTVYKGRQNALGIDVCIKELKDIFGYFSFLQRGEVVKRLKREFCAQAQVRHPSVLAVLDQSTDAGKPYVVMELMQGSLRDRLEKAGGKGLPVSQAIRILLQLSYGLRAAHATGLTHHNLKPENVLFDAFGNAKLGDFGLARVIEVEQGKGLPQVFVGTGSLSYLAPELIVKKDAGPAADVYGLGILLYEMLTGGVPGRRSPLPSELNPEVPSKLDPHLRQDDPRPARVALLRLRRDAGRVLRRVQRWGVPPRGTSSCPPSRPRQARAHATPFGALVLEVDRAVRQAELLAHGQWRQAHEVFEDRWRSSKGEVRSLSHALAQLGAALIKWSEDHPEPAATLLGRARGHLEDLPSRVGGLDVEQLESEVLRLQENLARGEPAPGSLHLGSEAEVSADSGRLSPDRAALREDGRAALGRGSSGLPLGFSGGLPARCPYCGESVTVQVEATGAEAERYVEDCPVCCRPWQVRVHRDPDGPSVELFRDDD